MHHVVGRKESWGVVTKRLQMMLISHNSRIQLSINPLDLDQRLDPRRSSSSLDKKVHTLLQEKQCRNIGFWEGGYLWDAGRIVEVWRYSTRKKGEDTRHLPWSWKIQCLQSLPMYLLSNLKTTSL